MSYITAEEFLKQSEKVQRELLEWWKPVEGDLITGKYPMNIAVIKPQADIEQLNKHKGSYFMPLLQQHHLTKFIEDKIGCKFDTYYYDRAGYDFCPCDGKGIEFVDLGHDLLQALWQVACEISERL